MEAEAVCKYTASPSLPSPPELALTYGTYNAGVMLAGHLTICISALHHQSFVHLSARGRRGTSGLLGYSPVSVVQLHISAVNAICIMKTQPLVISNHIWVGLQHCLILLQDMLCFLLLFSAIV